MRRSGQQLVAREGVATFVEAVLNRRRPPEEEVYAFLGRGEEVTDRLTWGELKGRVRRLAWRLRDLASPGERVLLLHPSGLEFPVAFLATLAAGLVAVPCQPPRGRRDSPRLRALAEDSEPSLVLAASEVLRARESVLSGSPSLAAIPWIEEGPWAEEVGLERAGVEPAGVEHRPWVDETPVLAGAGVAGAGVAVGATTDDSDEERWPAPPSPDDLAFLQYTSGSTGDPKGVEVLHRNLVHNQEMIRRAFGQDEGSVVVSWLPLYHDMGLIGGLLQPLYVGGRCVLMSPASFLQRPARWLEAISRFGATTSGGPSFAYELCAQRIDPQRSGLDLSSWRVAFNGAEPVRAEVLDRFAESFAGVGFDRRSFFPCYGLAEATLLVTGRAPDAEPAVGLFDRDSLERGDVERAPEGADPGTARALVGCGGSWLGQRVLVVDPESHRPLDDLRVGEIWVAGGSVAGGYWRRGASSKAIFQAQLEVGSSEVLSGFLRTGDLGFWSEDELYVTGRLKDLIVLRGRNLYPQDVEWAAENSHPGLASAAAFAVDPDEVGSVVEGGTSGERLVVIQEVVRRLASPRRRDELVGVARAIRRAVAEAHDVALDRLVLVAPGRLPKTSSGKVRRRACREQLLSGALETLFDDGGSAAATVGEPALVPLDARTLAGLPAASRRAALRRWLDARLALEAGVAAVAELDRRATLPELGLDSLAIASLVQAMESDFGLTLPFDTVFDFSLEQLEKRVLAAVLDATVLDATVLDADGRTAAEPEASLLLERQGETEGDHPTAYGQRALWYLDRLTPSAATSIAAAARSRSRLDAAALAQALTRLVARHPALRTTFIEQGDELWQRVHTELAPDFAVTRADEDTLEAFLEAESRAPFDLETGSPIRVRLISTTEADYLLWVVHHAVADLASLTLLLRELGGFYGDAVAVGSDVRSEDGRRESSLGDHRPPVPTLRQSDLAHWQRRVFGDGSVAEGQTNPSLRYWLEILTPPPPALDLPVDRPRPAEWRGRGLAVQRLLDRSLGEAVTARARGLGCTPSVLIAGAFQALLLRLTGQPRLAVAMPALGRRQPELADVVGFFVNPVVLVAEGPSDPTMGDWLPTLQRQVARALAHQSVPFALLVERLEPRRDPARPPLVQALFAHQTTERKGDERLAAFALGQEGVVFESGPLELVSKPLDLGATSHEIALMTAEVEGRLSARLDLAADLFDRTTGERWLRAFESVLSQLVETPERRLSELDLLGQGERHQLVHEWSAVDGGAIEAGGDTLTALLDAQTRRTPTALALIDGERRLTYGELHRRARHLARRLVALGVRPEERVGVSAGRTAELVAALLAVLRAGGAYLALDPSYPEARLRGMAADGGVRWVLHDGETPPWLPEGVTAVSLAETLDGVENEPETGFETTAAVHPDQLAYVLFTSGSTGRPKGVAVTQQGAAALVRWARRHYDDHELGGTLAATSINFDLSVFELFAPLAWGGTVILAPDALALPGLPARDAVRLVNTVPSVLAELLAGEGLPASVTTVNLAGEALRRELVEAAEVAPDGAQRAVWNLYGPSEDTTYSTAARVRGRGRGLAPAIGRPLPGGRARVLDRWLRPVASGAHGELCLGGVGLARGYLGQPARTAEVFVPDPGATRPGARLYRTGDRVRFRADGELDFLGRFDHQVKIRGFRIEPGEVEALLAGHPAVAEAAVVVSEGTAGPRLVAHWVPVADAESAQIESAQTEAMLRRHLEDRLPPYLRPGGWVPWPRLPRLGSGKIDRRTLVDRAPVATSESDPPQGPDETLVAGLIAELLGRDAVGRDDDFFALGGHSLLAARLVSRLQQERGVSLPLTVVLRRPTVAGLAEALGEAETELEPIRRAGSPPHPSPLPTDSGGEGTGTKSEPLAAELELEHPPAPLSFTQERLWFLDRLDPGSRDYTMPFVVELDGMLDRRALDRAVSAVIARHEVLRSHFPSTDGRPRVEVEAPTAVLVPEVDLRGLPEGRRAEVAEALLGGWARRSFDLARGPLWQVLWLRAEGDQLAWNLHHTVADGRSLEILWRDLAAAYEGVEPEGPRLQFGDVARWQRQRMSTRRLRPRLEFWRRRLAGVPALDLPTDRPRGASARSGTAGPSRGQLLPVVFDPATAAALGRLAGERGTTVFTVLAALYAGFLHRLAAQDDLAVGTAVSLRPRPELRQLVGPLVDTVALRSTATSSTRVSELVEAMGGRLLEAHDHGDVPFERVVEAVAPERRTDAPALFQTMLVLQGEAPSLGLGGLEGRARELDRGASPFHWTLSLRGGVHGLSGVLELDRQLFDPTTGLRMLRSLEVFLRAGAEQPGTALGALPWLTTVERHQLCLEWSTARSPQRQRISGSVAGWLAESLRRSPESTALIDTDDQAWSILRLAERVVTIRGLLGAVDAAGLVGDPGPVAVVLDRSPDAIATFLAVLTAGGAYLPLDPQLPEERMAFVLTDARVTRLVGRGESLRRLPEGPWSVIDLDRAPTPESNTADGTDPATLAHRLDAPPPHPEAPAYVLYTSGSTGRPKGVVVPHRALVDFVAHSIEDYGIAFDDRVLQFNSLVFDASIEEIYPTLAVGGTLVLRSELGSTAELLDRCRRAGVTVLDLPTGYWHTLVSELVADPEAEWPPSIRLVILGGEQALVAPLRAFRRRVGTAVRVVNSYGPTETTVVVSRWRAREEAPGATAQPIGGPVAGTALRVVDHRLEPTALGQPGELVISGDGVATGYLGRPAITAASFVPDPLGAPSARLYRSGDRVRWLAEGVLEFIGRSDAQVKVRGFRVEPGEIEAVLAEQPEVAQGAVVVGRGGCELVAFVAPAPADVALDAPELARELLRRLRSTLPAHLVPTVVEVLDALPTLATGKVDRRRLATLAAERAASSGPVALSGEVVEEPSSPAEELVAGVWRDLLGVDSVGADGDFFALGGHSLLATQAVSRLRRIFGVELPLRRLFEAPTVAEVARAMTTTGAVDGSPLPALEPRVADEAEAPLTFAQERLWFLHQLDPTDSAYNVAAAVDLDGPLDPQRLAAAFGALVRRQPSLRTVFEGRAGQPIQRTVEPTGQGVGHGVARVDLRWLADAQRNKEVERLGRGFARRPFDLATPPLRSALLVLGEARHRWLLVLHHLVCDGWSMDVLVREWATLYTSGSTDAATASLPALPLTLADVATWQRQVLEGERIAELLAIEGRRLADLPVLELPTDRPRTADTGSAGRRLVGHLPASLVERLDALGRRHHGTLFMVLLAAYRTLLVRWSGQDDLAVGAPVANRRDPRLESLAGFLVDTLVFRTPPPADSPTPERFVDLLARTRGDALAGFASQDLPFERLVEALVPRRDLSTPPLVQTLFALQPAAAPHPSLGELRLEPTALDTGGVKFDLALALEPRATEDGTSRGLEMVLELRRDLFDVTTGLRFLAHFRALLEQVVEHPVAPLDRLAHTPRAEHHQLLHEWAEGGQARTSSDDTLDGRFFAQARRTPDAPALVWRGESWTYAALASHALALAGRLRDSGVGDGDRVALLLPREPRLVAAILAVLAAGSAYVPLDPAYPEERQQHILGDSGAVLLLASEAPSWALPTHCRRMTVEPLADRSAITGSSMAEPPVQAEATRRLAYLIYTSGSTGLPKGVAIEHRSALAMVDWATATFSSTELDGVLAGTSVCFDLSIFELFAPLTSGGRVVLAGSALELHDPDVAGQVRMINTVPSAIAELTRERELPPSVRTVNLAGEPLRRSLVDRVYDAGPAVERVFDLYGPSEDTTYSTFALARRDDRGEPAIGRPLPGTRAHVIDRWGRLLSPPAVGELVLGGVGVARGYVGRPAQTAERFVPDPWGAAGERLYRTGDRVRWGTDGQLHYLGRFDHQVKVRGYRIELGEIETRLRALPGVDEAVVVAREDRGEGLVAGLRQQLVAYVGQADPSAQVDAEGLRRNLAEGLPDYMVPHAFVVLDALPQTPNGKVDRAALPEPDSQGNSTGSAPGSELEALVAGLFAEVLLGDRGRDHRDRDEGRPEVAADDDFFRLGGHSLLATQLVARLGLRCGVDLGVRRVFEHPTPRALARAIEEVRRGGALPPRPALVASGEAGDAPLSAAQERLWFLHQLEPELGLYTMPVVTQIEGEVVPTAQAAALSAIVARHEVLRTVYPEGEDGPVQRVLSAEAVALPEVDLGALPSARREGEARRLASVFCGLPFDLAGGPPLRALGLRLAADEHWLVLALHHIAADGWSLGVLLGELAELYDAALQDRAPRLPGLAVQMGDVARWQRQALSDDRLAALLGRQRARLAGAPQHLPLPLDRPRPEHPSGRGGVVPLTLGRDTTGALMRVAKEKGVTPMMVVTTAVVALLRRLSGVDDLLFGTPVANRLDPALEPLIGCLVNTLVLRSHLPGDPTFEQLLASTRDAALAAYDSQELPFERLVAELDPSRDLARSPLFQVLVIWQDTPRPALRLGPCALRPVEGLGRTAKFDLTFELRLEEGALRGELEFADDLFERGTAERLAIALGVVFEALAEDPSRRLSALDGPAFEGWGPVEARPETPLLAVAVDQALTVTADVDEGPVGPIETTLAEIWCEVLDLERVGRHQDFFALGGHSLLAARVASRLRRRLGAELPLRAIFETRTVAALAERLGSAGEAKAQATIEQRQVGPDEADTAPLAFAQERLFFLDRLHPGDPQYHMPAALDLRGSLDVGALAAALAALARRHGALRTTFGVSSAGETFQRLAPSNSVVTAAWWPSVVDLSGLADDGLGERVLEGLLARHARQPFDLDSGPLVRALLVRRSADVHVLSLVSHHLVSDGWSQEILVRELGTLYSVFAAGSSEAAGDQALEALSALPVTYADFARWQRQELTGERLESLLAWWRQTLHGAPPVLELPIDRPRPTQRDARGAWVEVDWPRSTAEAVETLAWQHGATPFMVLMAFWGAVLERFTGRRDLVVGTPVAGRPLPELEGLLGLFVDTLALRLDLAEDPTVQTLVERMRGTVLDAFEHQALPFERLVAELAPARDLGHTPLVQGVLAVQNQPAARPKASGLELEARGSHGGSAKFDLTLALEPRSDGVGGQLEYAVALFDRTTIERLLDQLRRLVEDAAMRPEARVGELARLSPAERHQLGIEVPGRVDPAAASPSAAPALHHLFFARAEEHPERIALVAGEQRFTYGELAARAQALATRLRALGLGAEQRVAILLERGPRQVVAILGVLASGAAYVPVDPNHPVERIAHVLRDAEVEAVVGEARPGSAREAVPPEVPVLILDDGEAAQATTATGVGFDWRRAGGDRLAYVLYTSGSTGRPKGVGVTHRNVLALLAAGEATFDFGPDDVWSLFHSTAFDFSVWELWGALAWGGRVVLVSETLRRSPRDFARLLVDEGVTVLDQTPSAFRALAEFWRRENGAPASLRWVIFGGEGLDGRTLRAGSFPWAEEGPTLVNMYGITETTVHVTRRALEPVHRGLDGPVPVGEALPGWGFGVYDRRLRLQPPGAPGEIGVSGLGLARGYLGRPALTAERFVPDPETREPGGRLYRSGDLGRRRADGEVEVLGRIDGQVKIRGHRIELQDVAAALDRHPSVGRAEVVLLDRGDDPQLVACVLPVAGADEATLDPDGLRRWSQRTLPEAMRPAAFLTLDQLPLTVNGKLDRRALEQHARELIGAALRRTAGAYVEPRTDDERALATIWAEVLGLEKVGVEDSFFDLGGHSLLMVRVQTRLEQHLGRPVPILDLFEHPTVATLATHLAASSSPAETAATEPETSILEQRRERVAGRRARSQQRRRQRSRRRGDTGRGDTGRDDKTGGKP